MEKGKKTRSRADGVVVGLLVASLCVVTFAGAQTARAATPAHDEVRVEMLGTKLGTLGQVFCQALVDIVNKNHPWLKLSVTETMGTADSLKTFLNLSPAKKKNIFALGGDIDFLAAKAGRAPFTKAHGDLRFVANMLKLVTWPMTLKREKGPGK